MAKTLRPWQNAALRPFEDLYREVDSLYQQFLRPEEGQATPLVPPLNIAETDEGYEVTVDLPGMKPEDVNVEMQDGQLTISGKRESEVEEKGKTFHRIEKQYGEFRRVIALPNTIDALNINAEYKEGVLHVFLPKSNAKKPTRIQVSKS